MEDFAVFPGRKTAYEAYRPTTWRTPMPGLLSLAWFAVQSQSLGFSRGFPWVCRCFLGVFHGFSMGFLGFSINLPSSLGLHQKQSDVLQGSPLSHSYARKLLEKPSWCLSKNQLAGSKQHWTFLANGSWTEHLKRNSRWCHRNCDVQSFCLGAIVLLCLSLKMLLRFQHSSCFTELYAFRFSYMFADRLTWRTRPWWCFTSSLTVLCCLIIFCISHPGDSLAEILSLLPAAIFSRHVVTKQAVDDADDADI